jgi:hypothetical protein
VRSSSGLPLALGTAGRAHEDRRMRWLFAPPRCGDEAAVSVVVVGRVFVDERSDRR